MARTVTADQARSNFSDLLQLVASTKQPVVVEEAGEPVVVVISPDDYRRLKRDEDRLWETVRRVQDRNADKDPDEIYRDVTEIVEEVRQEMYDERQRSDQSSR